MTAEPIAPVIPSPGRLAGTLRVKPAAVRPLPMAGPAAACPFRRAAIALTCGLDRPTTPREVASFSTRRVETPSR